MCTVLTPPVWTATSYLGAVLNVYATQVLIGAQEKASEAEARHVPENLTNGVAQWHKTSRARMRHVS
jgi:predicted thioesterase